MKIKDIENIKYYPCFSGTEKNFLKSKGLKYLIKCRHFESDNKMWLFIYDDEKKLDNALTEWTNSKEEYRRKHGISEIK